MSKRAIATLLSVVAVVAIVAYALAATIGGGATHTMPNGQMMDGTMGNMTHEMPDGQTMTGMMMTTP